MNCKSRFVYSFALLLALPVAAFAAGAGDLSYNYLGGQVGYANVDGNFGGDSDGAVLGIDGSAELVPNINLVGSYNVSVH